MPNGGTDYCVWCRYNQKEADPAEVQQATRGGFCTIRGVPVDVGSGPNSCLNHPHHNPDGIMVPVGPVFESHADWRYVAVKSPDSEEIRTTLLDLLRGIQEQLKDDYGIGYAYFDYAVIWQLGEFLEERALDDLQRLASFDKALETNGGRGNQFTVLFAEDAILKILCKETPDVIGKWWPFEVLELTVSSSSDGI
jgi:hypothetical protein